MTSLTLPVGFDTAIYNYFSFANFSADSLNTAILNLADGTAVAPKYFYISKTSLDALNVAYPNAVSDAAARYIDVKKSIPLGVKNLLLYSQLFSNSVWGIAGYGAKYIITDNSIIAPTSSQEGSTLTETGGTQSRIVQPISVLSGRSYYFSVFVKRGTKGSVSVLLDATGTSVFGDIYTAFSYNFDTGILSGSSKVEKSIVPVFDGWFRLVGKVTAVKNTVAQMGIYGGYNGGSVYCFGAQLNIDALDDYCKTTNVAKT